MKKSSDTDELRLKPVETIDELRLANDLMAKTHCPDYFQGLNWLETCGAGYPGFRREHTRIALWNGDLAGALRLNTETIRLGEARLKMGGFAWVTTSPRHRHKGICRALMWHALEYMKHNNYHVSMLFGIPNFYHRFGFTTTLAEYSIMVDVSEALSAPRTPFKVREAKPGDISAIQKLHATNDADVACSLVRSNAHITNTWDRYKSTRVIMTDNGRVTAYFVPCNDGPQLRIDEVGVSGLDACANVLRACAQMAGEEAAGTLRFQAPPSHPFARYLLRLRSTHEMRVVRDQGGMMAFVDLPECLENLIPEWESLLQKSALASKRIELTLYADQAFHRIRANRGAIDIAQTTGLNKVSLHTADLMHLVTGYRHVEDVLAQKRRIMSPEARDLMHVLFPKRTPYVWAYDHF